jgi:hypothetical protein
MLPSGPTRLVGIIDGRLARKTSSARHGGSECLIAATPVWWKSASLVVDREQEGSQELMTIVITSPEGQPEPVNPTEEI